MGRKTIQHESTPGHAQWAIEAMLRGDTEAAVKWLRRIPRVDRPVIKLALDDLDMELSRLGRQYEYYVN